MEQAVNSAPISLLTLTLSAGLAAAQPAGGSPSRVLLDLDFRATPIEVVSLSGSELRARDAEGRAVTLPRAHVLAILARQEGVRETPSQEDRVAPTAQPRVRLVDGQVFPGAPASEPAAPDSLRWEVPGWGPITIPLDRVASVSLSQLSAAERKPGAADRVLLTNGDTAEGFVAGIGGVIRIEGARDATTLPTDRARGVVFSNPDVPPAGTMIWLVSDVVAAVDTLTVDAAGVCSFVPVLGEKGTGPRTAPFASVRAVVFDSARVRALATVPWVNIGAAPGSTRRWTPPPVSGDPARAALFAADIELPGPMTVEWDIPQGARVLAGDAELPQACRVWGDCTLSIRAGDGTVLWEQRLTGEKPEGSFRLDLPQGLSRLKMIVDPGASGAVQDRVVLRAPVLLVDP
ncbi:MAG: hypothetical protein DYG92_06680 [Leptolyngbya sp. PLA1]|nr:hypothetical protein [Leptolyngbya sp. PLA1]